MAHDDIYGCSRLLMVNLFTRNDDSNIELLLKKKNLGAVGMIEKQIDPFNIGEDKKIHQNKIVVPAIGQHG